MNRKWCSKEIKKASSEKTPKFRRKVIYILLEKGLLEFFRFFIGLQISENYLRTTFTFGKLPYKFHVVMFILYLDLFFYKSVPELKRYCLGLSTSRINESVGWKYMLQSSSVCTFNSQRVRTFSQQTFVFKTSCKNIFKTSSRRLQKPLQDIFKTSSRRITKLNCSC